MLSLLFLLLGVRRLHDQGAREAALSQQRRAPFLFFFLSFDFSVCARLLGR